MYSYKSFPMLIIPFLLLLATYISAEEKSFFPKQFELIDREEKGMLDLVQEENNRIKRAETLERQRLEKIASVKRQAEEEQRRAERIVIQRIIEENQRLEVVLAEQEQLKLKRIAAAKRKKERRITAHIDLSQQKMKVFKGKKLMHTWRVSTARKGYATPVGNFQPQFIERMHHSKLYHNSPMPYSIFFKGNFAIHGTNSIRKLGRKASHGCVRLHPKNAKKLYALVRKYGKDNTFIKIRY